MPAPLPAAPTLSPADSIASLLDRIVAMHHTRVRAATSRIEQLAREMCDFAGADPSILLEIRQLAGGLGACADAHLDREARLIFPTLRRLESQTSISRCHAGMIRSQLAMAERELARIRGVVLRLHELARESLSPAGPCESCHELVSVASALIDDLRQYTLKESQVLFPWAIAREAELSQ